MKILYTDALGKRRRKTFSSWRDAFAWLQENYVVVSIGNDLREFLKRPFFK